MKIKGLAWILFLAILFITIFSLSACSNDDSLSKNNSSKSGSSMVLIEISSDWEIYYHRDTKVMYIARTVWVGGGGYGVGLTVMVDADGKPLLYEGD